MPMCASSYRIANVAESDLLTLRKRDKNFVCYTTEFGPTDHLL